MRKLFLSIVILCVYVGLTGTFLSSNFSSDCHQGCSCCSDSCDCQPALCSFSSNTVFVVEAKGVIPEITLKVVLPQRFVFPYTDEPVRDIFHPPRYS
jgi:hypothetical protein